jgi:hypothetical protein
MEFSLSVLRHDTNLHQLTYDVGEYHFEQWAMSEHPLQFQPWPTQVQALLFGRYCHLQHKRDCQ